MIFWTLLFLHGAQVTGSQPNGNIGSPENITVQVLDPKTVQVFWSSIWNNVERFDVTYNPTEDKIVSQAAGNSQSIVLRELRPDTQYQVIITAVIGGKNYKSRRIVFRTSPDQSIKSDTPPTPSSPDSKGVTKSSTEYVTVDPTAKYMPQTSSTVRGVELGLVLLALVVWIVAIALFFHRWGKIRMLLPYQPDYKTQQSLKVPGTGTTMGTSCSSGTGPQGQQEGPGCIQHTRWSSNCNNERPTAKRWKRRESPERVQPSTYQIREDCEYYESPQVVTHHGEDTSVESIALCQLNRSPEKKVVTISLPHAKHTSSFDAIADSVQDLLRRGQKHGKCEATKSELEPLFFVGDKDFYREDASDTKIVVHHYPKHSEEGPDECQRPKRYSRSSLRKQKVSLFNEKEFDLYKSVPIVESKPKMENKATETDKPKSSSSSSYETAEMKRKAFLRKISLQDTYLNYNQDYWLDYKKSIRFHKSIDLGYFESEQTRKPEVDKPKPRLSERITEKSGEAIDEAEVPYETRSSCGRSVVMADLRKGGPVENYFILPSSENIPLFCERNGNIETDFDVFGDNPEEEECLLIEKADGPYPSPVTVDNPPPGTDIDFGPRSDIYDSSNAYDFTQFYEINLTADEPVRRSTVFDFQGGHAFFGEVHNSTSDDSDVFYNESEIGEAPGRTDQTYPGRILFVSGSDKPRNSGIV